MDADDEYFFVVRTIEDADAAAFGQTHVVRQRKSCSSSSALGLFEAEDFASLRIDPRHDVPYGAIFAGGVYALEDE